MLKIMLHKLIQLNINKGNDHSSDYDYLYPQQLFLYLAGKYIMRIQ